MMKGEEPKAGKFQSRDESWKRFARAVLVAGSIILCLTFGSALAAIEQTALVAPARFFAGGFFVNGRKSPRRTKPPGLPAPNSYSRYEISPTCYAEGAEGAQRKPGVSSDQRRWVVDETGRRVEVPDSPQRIISIAPNVTEILYALGLESRVVGRTDYCDYPPQAKLKPSVGGLINPNIETIISLHPDLVIGTPEVNKIEIADQLLPFHIPLYGVHARNLDDVLRSLQDVGALAGVQSKAETLVESLRKRRDAAVKEVAGLPRPRVLYLIWYSPISVPGRGAFLTNLISLAGGESISADLKPDWGQMSLEEIVRRDPEIILIPKSNESSPPIDQIKTWPGWSSTTAARTNRILLVDDNANLPGPRLFDALEQFAKIFHPGLK